MRTWCKMSPSLPVKSDVSQVFVVSRASQLTVTY